MTLLALLPPGVPFDDLGVFIFFEELDFDFGRAEGDGDDVREEGDDRRDDDGVDDRSASRTYLMEHYVTTIKCDFGHLR